MTAAPRGRSALPMRLFLATSAVVATAALVVGGRRVASGRAAAARALADRLPVAVVVAEPPAEPIAAEAQVFRTRAAALAIEPSTERRRPAHPRSLATWRSLRAYPGAPPRVPHGLTPAEFRTGGCKTCHERGGFSERFGAYVPLTPHPQMGACLQCHVGNATLMAIALPSTEPSARCRQCHAPGAMKWRDSSLAWAPMAWPKLAPVTSGRTPPPIPHRLQMRENCLSCHSGPSGVMEIQTRHPERANCRQCHVPSTGDVAPFVRVAQGGGLRPGFAP